MAVLPTLSQLLAPNESAVTDPTEIAQLLSELANHLGVKAIGLRWPLENTARFAISANTVTLSPSTVAELRRGLTTVSEQEERSRLFAPLSLSGRPPGAVFLEQPKGETWNDQDRELALFLGRLLGRCAFLSHREEMGVDQDRLLMRLSDGAVIAGRMAHDFDNILTGLLGFADLSASMVPVGSQPHKYLAEITKAAQRGVIFTEQLHQLSRSGQVRPRRGNISQAITKEETRLREHLPPTIRLEKSIPDGLPDVGIEPEPLSQILGHLMGNAVEACAKGGTVRVEAGPTDLSVPDVDGMLGSISPGPAVAVTVIDTGSGMKPEVFARIFVEPFFTTKVRHRGLGLAIVYRLLRAHRGGIRIDTAEGEGTRVKVALPLARF